MKTHRSIHVRRGPARSPRLFGILVAIFVSIAFASSVAFAGVATVDYTFTPVLKKNELVAVDITLAFRGGETGITKLQLPDAWGGETELWRGISDLSVRGASIESGDGPAQRILHHRPNARIGLHYRVTQEKTDYLNTLRGSPFRVVVQPGYFHLIGHAALVVPNIDDDTPVHVRTHSMPKSWTFASDLEHVGTTLRGARSSISVGGDFRVLHPSESNPMLRLAIRGGWSFDTTVFATHLSQILTAQSHFWGDTAMPYLVTVLQLPAQPNSSSSGGTGLGDAFAFFATPNVKDDVITGTLAHEGMHTWIPALIGGMPEKDEALGYWLSEGFTDFYRSRLLLREGVWTPTDFAADLNRVLRSYATSHARTASNATILADFWRDRDVRALPYQRGHLLAHLWNGRLRASGGLDPIMLDMHRRAIANEHVATHRYAPEIFVDSMTAAGLDIRADVSKFIDAGEPILLPKDLLAPCGSIETREVPAFDWGFDMATTQSANMHLTHVDPESQAYAAGLRDGMLLVRREAGEIGDSEQELAYRVNDAGTERTIRYWPQGKTRVLLQHFNLNESPAGEAEKQCRKRLSGIE